MHLHILCTSVAAHFTAFSGMKKTLMVQRYQIVICNTGAHVFVSMFLTSGNSYTHIVSMRHGQCEWQVEVLLIGICWADETLHVYRLHHIRFIYHPAQLLCFQQEDPWRGLSTPYVFARGRLHHCLQLHMSRVLKINKQPPLLLFMLRNLLHVLLLRYKARSPGRCFRSCGHLHASWGE